MSLLEVKVEKLTNDTSRKSRILVIDDEKDLCDLFEVFLDETFHIEVCSSGPLAITKITENSYDLVMTDVNMPDVDGIKIIEFVRKTSPNTPVVVMSGYSNTHPRVSLALASGACQSLKKPFANWDTLPELLDKIVAEQRSSSDNN